MKPVRIVLSGGGVRGVYQIGWLSAFFEAFPDIEVENVYGCSVGALLSPMIANKRTDLALKLLESFADLNAVVEKWPCCLPKLCGAIFCLGAFKRFNLTDKIWKVLSAEEIATAEDKCHVVTYDVMNRTEVWFTGKDLKLGCEASSALWLAVPPVKINGGLYADGGVTEIVPQAKLDNRKDVVTIFVDLKPREGSKPRTKPPGNAIELMSDLHDAASHQLTQLEIANLEARLGPNLVIAQPAGDPFESALDFDKGKMKQVYDDGYSTAKAMVEDIRRKL